MIVIDGETETKYYYHFDGLGSVVALSDSTGSIVEQYSYDVFGEPNRVSDVNNPYLFTGRRYDSETALYYYRARYYKPAIGRFLQTDPIPALNLYTYCGNNPLNWIDPLGLCKNLLGRDYSLQETEEILREGRETFPYNPLRHAFVPEKNVWPVGKGWDYGFGEKTHFDRFAVPNPNSKKGFDMLTAIEFGNYLAGYMGKYHLGILGYWGARAAGNAYGGGGSPWFFSGDDAPSIRNINRGSRDAIIYRQQHLPLTTYRRFRNAGMSDGEIFASPYMGP